jgi:hypothetical protein
LTEVWVVPELGHNFTENFAVMLIDHIYNNWSYTGLTGGEEGLNKPPTRTGSPNYIEFRAGIEDEYKTLEVLALQGRTVVVDHLHTGWKRESMTTQVWVTTKIKVAEIDDETSLLRKMDQEVGRICGMYRQANQSGEMRGIKDLIYEGNDRLYGTKDQWNKSDWKTRHSILMWYELMHGDQ